MPSVTPGLSDGVPGEPHRPRAPELRGRRSVPPAARAATPPPEAPPATIDDGCGRAKACGDDTNDAAHPIPRSRRPPSHRRDGTPDLPARCAQPAVSGESTSQARCVKSGRVRHADSIPRWNMHMQTPAMTTVLGSQPQGRPGRFSSLSAPSEKRHHGLGTKAPSPTRPRSRLRPLRHRTAMLQLHSSPRRVQPAAARSTRARRRPPTRRARRS